MGLNEEIIVADTNNHRIQVLKKFGNITYQFGIPGKKKGELWFPRKVLMLIRLFILSNQSTMNQKHLENIIVCAI